MTRGHPAPVVLEPGASTIDACRRGDRHALEAVFRAHMPVLEHLITRLVGPTADVEDLLQATLIEAIGAFPRFRGKASVRTWLGRIAVNVVHQHLRRPEHRRTRVTLELVRGEQEPVDPAPQPDCRAHSRRQLERLYQHLGTIGVKKRLALILFVFDGRTIEEVAALMAASRVATKSRIFWARRELVSLVDNDPVLRELIQDQEGAA